jgi:hypothetical protein
MNKIYTQFFLCLFVCSVSLAQIPNPSFENWTTYNGINFSGQPYSGERPTGWQTTDSLSQFAQAGNTVVREGLINATNYTPLSL